MPRKAPTASRSPLTKTLFASGLQCCKRLYLEFHDPDGAPQPSPRRAALLEVGRKLVELACQAFPNGQRADADDVDLAVEQTESVLRSSDPAVLFDAAFRHDGVEVRADIIVKSADGHLELFEVKSGAKVKARHVKDVAFQAYAIQKSGYEVERATILHLNSHYRHQGGNNYPVHTLFKNVDVTDKVKRQIERVEEQIARFQTVLDDPATRELPTGTWCRLPFECGYLPTCRDECSANPLLDLPELTREQEVDFHQQGVEDITQIDPQQDGLTMVQRRALRAVNNNALELEPFVGRELRDVEYPLHFVSMGTLLQVLPAFPESHPWQHIPFQWTDVVVAADGRREVASFIPDNSDDPREQFLSTLVEQVQGPGTVMLYGHSVEQRLRELLETLPDHKPGIRSLLNRARFDLHQLVHAGVYHPDFRSSFEIGPVHAAVVGGSPKKELEIRGDAEASLAYQRLLNSRTRATTRSKLTKQLEAWGERQCETIVSIFFGLLEAAEDEAAGAGTSGADTSGESED